MSQLDLFAAARAARDDALQRVDDHADPEWKDIAHTFCVAYLRAHPTMFPDDLWNAGLPKPREMRAIGPVILRLAREGLMVRSGEYRPRTLGHLTPGTVWRSLICDTQTTGGTK